MQLYFGFGLKMLFWDRVTTRVDVAVSVGIEGGAVSVGIVGGAVSVGIVGVAVSVGIDCSVGWGMDSGDGWLADWVGGDGVGEGLADSGGEGVGVGEVNGTCSIGKGKSLVLTLGIEWKGEEGLP